MCCGGVERISYYAAPQLHKVLRSSKTADPRTATCVQPCKNESAMDNDDAAEESKNEECPNEEVGN